MTDELLDAGAQAERTALAWQRTGFAAAAAGAILTRVELVRHPVASLPGLLLMAAGVGAAAFVAPIRYVRVLRAIRSGRSPSSGPTLLGATVLLVLVALAAGASVALGL